MSNFSTESAKQAVQFAARQLGFIDCRIARADRAAHADAFLDWIEDGAHGEMQWMERNAERRTDPRQLVPEARSIVCLALNYYPGAQQPTSTSQGSSGRIARYAWNNDYHDLIESKLADLDETLKLYGGQQRYYVDTGPVLERDFANEAGLGWSGKSTVQIHPKFGPWFFLAELITTLDLSPDPPMSDHCGKCTACLDLCPTGAITEPHRVDARKCISYLTIENPGPIPVQFRKAIGDRIYGCDECLEVCPWNRFAKQSREQQLLARPEIFKHSLRSYLSLSTVEFQQTFRKSPIKRIKRERFLRNVCVALGNVGTVEDLPALETAVATESDLISEHARWAIDQIESKS